MSLGLGLGLMMGQNVAATAGGGSTATWDTVNSDASWGTYTNGNLTATHSTTSDGIMLVSGGAKASGTFSVTINALPVGGAEIGVRSPGFPVNTWVSHGDVGVKAVAYNTQNGQIIVAGVGAVATPGAAAAGDIVTVVYSSSSVEFKKNGVSMYTYATSANIPATANAATSANQVGIQVTLDPTGW